MPSERHRLSHLLRPLNILPHNSQENLASPVESACSTTSRSYRLMVDQGIIKPVATAMGIFYYLPLAVRCVIDITTKC